MQGSHSSGRRPPGSHVPPVSPPAVLRRAPPVRTPAARRRGATDVASAAPSFQYDPDARHFGDVGLLRSNMAPLRPGRRNALGRRHHVRHPRRRAIVGRCARTNEFTLQAIITPSNIQQGPPQQPPPDHRLQPRRRRDRECQNVALGQEADRLILFLRNKAPDQRDRAGIVDRIELCSLADQRPNHILITYRPGQLLCYLKGQLVKQTDAIKGTLTWTDGDSKTALHFGGRPDVRSPWRGKLEAIAIFDRSIDPEIAANEFAATSRSSKPASLIAQVAIAPRLLATTAPTISRPDRALSQCPGRQRIRRRAGPGRPM